MNINIDGSTVFNVGWLSRFVGLPRQYPYMDAKAEDITAFNDGWDMCNETPATGNPSRLDAFLGMLRHGQIVAVWVDDANESIPGIADSHGDVS